MKNHIDSASFGTITINGNKYVHDILISLDGNISKRKKKLSKRVFGTSHVISLDEAEYIYENQAEKILIGAGHNGMVILSVEANDFFKQKNCPVALMPTPEAVDSYNNANGNLIALFHITC